MVRCCRLALLMVLCALVGSFGPAKAHDLSLSGIQILYRSHDIVVTVTTPISRLIRSEGQGSAEMTPVQLDQAIRQRLHLRFDGKEFLPTHANVVSSNAIDRVSWQAIVTNPVKQCEVLSRLYPEDANSRTIVTVVRNGQAVTNALLDNAHPGLLSSQARLTPFAVALRYLQEGVQHILSGFDHILFVCGLLLFGGSLKSLLRTITAFTLAHSVTLTLAATGIFTPSPRIIEPLIALSIVAIAVENLRSQNKARLETEPKRDLRPYYAFGFGLIHGFGFAGALAEVGLPREALGVALASFNIGVEIGQALIVLAVFPVLTWFARHRVVLFPRAMAAGSILIGIVGAYWFVTRVVSV